jgi:dTDP-glucose 4,6-dehydratase
LPRTWDAAAPGAYTFIQVNINGDEEVLRHLFRDLSPEFVVNFAAQGMVAESWIRPWDWFATNTSGLSKILNALLDLPSLQKYVHVTTPEVYGSTDGWAKESFSFSPSTPYAVSRAAGDWHVMNLHKFKGLPVILTRAANVYGPGQQLYRVIPRAFLSGLLQEPFPLHGEGTSTRSFIHIHDVVEATYLLALSSVVGETFHISTNELISIRALVREIHDVLGQKEEKIERSPERDGKDLTYQLDSSKIRAQLGWEDRVGLSEGLEQVHQWLQTDLETFREMPRSYIHKF